MTASVIIDVLNGCVRLSHRARVNMYDGVWSLHIWETPHVMREWGLPCFPICVGLMENHRKTVPASVGEVIAT